MFIWCVLFCCIIHHAHSVQGNIEFKQQSLADCIDIAVACKVSIGNSCSIETLKPNSALNLIQPGGNTSCMNSDYPFVFSVELGATKDVLLYFQSGGVCLNQQQFDALLCNVCPTHGASGGIIDVTNSKNVFKQYTIIQIKYCSGDFHIGNKAAPFNDLKGRTMFSGQSNVVSVLRWIQDQQVKGFFPQVFDNFLIAGTSAGSAGVQFWSNEIMNIFKAKKFAVVADSFFAHLPTNTTSGESYEMKTFDTFGTCESPILHLPLPLLHKCSTRNLTSTDIFEYAISQNPAVPFYGVLAKNDLVQILFHNIIATILGIPNSQYTIAGPEFFNDLYANVLTPLNKYQNFLLFVIPGIAHTYVDQGYYFTTTEKGCTSSVLDEAIRSSCKFSLPSGRYFLNNSVDMLPLREDKAFVTNVCVDVVPTDNEPCGVFALPKRFPHVKLDKVTTVPTKRPSFRHEHGHDEDHGHDRDDHGHDSHGGNEDHHDNRGDK